MEDSPYGVERVGGGATTSSERWRARRAKKLKHLDHTKVSTRDRQRKDPIPLGMTR